MHLVVQAKHPDANGADGKPVFGSGRGMLTIHADDDDHLADFAEYMK
jgi:hypothetical protein